MSRSEHALDPFRGPGATAARLAAAAIIAVGMRCLARLDTSEVPPQLDLGRRPLLVTNHRSPLDYCTVVATCLNLHRWPSMFAREDFFDPAPSRYLLRTLGLIPASRGRKAPDGLRRAMRLMDDGRIVAIAAEGGLVRQQDTADGIGRIRGGAGRLAQHGADVTVLTITGAEAVWPPGARRPRLRAPWNRPTITVRARNVDINPGREASEANAAIRATMVDLVAHDGPREPAPTTSGSRLDTTHARS